MVRLSITLSDLPEDEARYYVARVRAAEPLGVKLTSEEYRRDYIGQTDDLLGSVSFYLTSNPSDDVDEAEEKDKDLAGLATLLAARPWNRIKRTLWDNRWFAVYTGAIVVVWTAWLLWRISTAA